MVELVGLPAAAFCAMALLGCVNIRPEWKFDPNLDLSGRETFRVASAGNAPSTLSADDQRLWTWRQEMIRGLIRDDLAAKGYREAAADADLRVDFFVASGLKGMETFHEAERRGKIDIHVSDPVTGTWLWHGWATETLVDRLDENEAIREAIPLILSKFPKAS